MAEKIRPNSGVSETSMPAPPTRSLRASAKSMNPQARMQELLREGTANTRRGTPEETSEEGSNEGNFTASEFPAKEGNSEVLGEDTQLFAEETPHAPPQTGRDIPAEQAIKRGGKTSARKPPLPQSATKQSLKDTVLEEGRAAEDRVSKTRLNVDIDEDLHFWLKGHAIQNRRKLNDLIPRILKAYRDEVEGE